MRGSWLALLLLFSATLLAGCAETPPPKEPDDGGSAGVVTSPDDFEYMQNESLANRSHVHDYWDGKETLLLVDEVQEGSTGLWMGDARSMNVFRPPDGHVVPQGTSRVTATLSWTKATGDQFGKAELWAKTAADDEPWLVGELESGAPVVVESTNDRNDLPHQTLSAWEFHFVLHPEREGAPLRFQGEVSLLAHVERGLDIPAYPGHPDAWANRTQIALLEAEHEVRYMGDAEGDWSCFGGCPVAHSPADGVIVPFDAAFVEVVLETSDPGVTGLGLKFHGADTREYTVAEPDEDADGRRVYRIPVTAGMGDGPYAKQSLWSFLPYIEAPEEDGFHSGSYRLTATAHRG